MLTDQPTQHCPTAELYRRSPVAAQGPHHLPTGMRGRGGNPRFLKRMGVAGFDFRLAAEASLWR
jgi:hypothetical protein